MIFLSLGSNVGDKTANLDTALGLLHLYGVRIVRVSSYYGTTPWGYIEQDDFVNAVAEVAFSGGAHELLAIALQIERSMGRIRLQKWGPRIIDIDIIDFFRQKINTETLTLPHRFYQERDFVLLPLRELEPLWEI